MVRIGWICLLMACVLVPLLLCASAAFAQKDKMSLGEAFGAQVIKAAPPAGAAVSPQPKADALAPQESLTVVPRPTLPSPYRKP